eukprot:528005-Alexandrium_andersonii.AAC.1
MHNKPQHGRAVYRPPLGSLVYGQRQGTNRPLRLPDRVVHGPVGLRFVRRWAPERDLEVG